jgi:hypothetical protein
VTLSQVKREQRECSSMVCIVADLRSMGLAPFEICADLSPGERSVRELAYVMVPLQAR